MISHIKLYNFRSHKSLDIELKKGINIIYGKNASGKTSVIEAIYMMSYGSSFLTKDISKIVCENEDFMNINLYVDEGLNRNRYSYSYENEKKIMSINGEKVGKMSEIFSKLSVLLFDQKTRDVFLEKEYRKKFFNKLLGKVSAEYIDAIVKYKSALQNRNALLKSERSDKTMLRVLTNDLIYYTEKIEREKFRILAIINGILGNEESKLVICCPSTIDYYNKGSLEKMYLDSEKDDLIAKKTTKGEHLIDYSILKDGGEVIGKASSAEINKYLLEILLAFEELLTRDGKKTILLLDDICGVLDENNVRKLFESLKNKEQVIITSVNDYPEYNQISEKGLIYKENNIKEEI